MLIEWINMSLFPWFWFLKSIFFSCYSLAEYVWRGHLGLLGWRVWILLCTYYFFRNPLQNELTWFKKWVWKGVNEGRKYVLSPGRSCPLIIWMREKHRLALERILSLPNTVGGMVVLSSPLDLSLLLCAHETWQRKRAAAFHGSGYCDSKLGF